MKTATGALLLFLSACSFRPARSTTSYSLKGITSSAQTEFPSAVTSAAMAGKPRLIRIYFNPYTDSIKPVLNYYINVEGEFSDGTFLPLTTEHVKIRSDVGTVEGNEWLIKPPLPWKKVTFYAEALDNPELRISLTQYIMQGKSEEDERLMQGR